MAAKPFMVPETKFVRLRHQWTTVAEMLGLSASSLFLGESIFRVVQVVKMTWLGLVV